MNSFEDNLYLNYLRYFHNPKLWILTKLFLCLLLTVISLSCNCFHLLLQKPYLASLWMKVKIAQSCPTLCDSMDYTVHGILQARILEWVAFPFSRGSSQPRDQTQVSRIAGGFFTRWATREVYEWSLRKIPLTADSAHRKLRRPRPAHPHTSGLDSELWLLL